MNETLMFERKAKEFQLKKWKDRSSFKKQFDSNQTTTNFSNLVTFLPTQLNKKSQRYKVKEFFQKCFAEIIQPCSKFQQQNKQRKMKPNLLLEMHDNQFPFGQIANKNVEQGLTKKIFVKKKVQYRSQNQKNLLENKISILTKLYHRNIINIRYAQELPSQGYNIYYNYVPFSLEKAFQEIDYESFKQLHRQIIHLAIHLAKNYIITPFHPSRCGVVFLDNRFIIKYYLPLNEIVFTQNITMLQRSVQLFKVRATHVLDTLCRNDLSESISSTTESLILKASHNTLTEKKLRESLEKRNRKLSNQLIPLHHRLFNSKSAKLLTNDAKRKASQDSTICSSGRISGLKQTLKILKQNCSRKRVWQKQKQDIRTRVQHLRLRSTQALEVFKLYNRKASEYIQLLKLVVQHQTNKRPI